MLDVVCENRNMCTWFLFNVCVYVYVRVVIYTFQGSDAMITYRRNWEILIKIEKKKNRN